MGIPSRVYDPISLDHDVFLLSDDEFDKKHNIVVSAKQNRSWREG